MTIRETQRAICPSSAAIEFATTFFVELKNEQLAALTGDGVSTMLSCEAIHDGSDAIRRRDALKLDWEHSASFLLPNFDGSLTARPASMNTDLTLEGSFTANVAAHDSLDTLALAISRVAMRGMLERIVSHVEAAWLIFSANCPTIEMCNVRRAVSVTGR